MSHLCRDDGSEPPDSVPPPMEDWQAVAGMVGRLQARENSSPGLASRYSKLEEGVGWKILWKCHLALFIYIYFFTGLF